MQTLESSRLAIVARQNLGVLPPQSATKREAPVRPPEICAEAMRAALWALTRDGHEPVYITRLLGAARRIAQPALPTDFGGQLEAVEKLLRDAHEEISTLGDIAVLPSGYRLPAPLRCVPLPVVGRWMLVGGLPSHKLPSAAREVLEHSGAARFFTRAPSELGLPLREQSAEHWCAQPTRNLADLKEWARRILVNAELRPVENLEAEFDAYAPGLVRGSEAQTLQFYRWTTQFQNLPDGRYLMRRRSVFGAIDARIGEMGKGQIVATGALHLDGGDVRRLCYGLDALADCPIAVWTKKSHRGVHLRLKNEVPGPEQRLFLALGQLQGPEDPEKYYPRDWVISTLHAPQIEAALHSLGVNLEERTW